MPSEADYTILDADGNETIMVTVSALQEDMSAEELFERVTEGIESAVADKQVRRR